MRGLNESNYKYQTSSVAGSRWANEWIQDAPHSTPAFVLCQ